ncbi:hypothetical protein AVEN_119064-1 [Araneus ventricosus]|uniref:Uncharacterized protein n=1 Tax=Araneus ventricosus TaxID=182803 RepID=A0A4Y2BL36_ARAVE|nr:hypothetical protein AVEN_119064-1 [Araneus ventricosus]
MGTQHDTIMLAASRYIKTQLAISQNLGKLPVCEKHNFNYSKFIHSPFHYSSFRFDAGINACPLAVSPITAEQGLIPACICRIISSDQNGLAE